MSLDFADAVLIIPEPPWSGWRKSPSPTGARSAPVRAPARHEVSAHLAEVHGADVSKETISTITDRVVDPMDEWQSRPLDRGRFLLVVANPDETGSVPRYAPNRMSPDVKRRYFELIRTGMRGARAAAEVGVSLSCGSVWSIDAPAVRRKAAAR
jgi:hypothetical protein